MLGSRNGAKVGGVQAAFDGLRSALRGPDLQSPETWTCQVETGVSEEPWGFPATVQGAQNRARAAFECLGSEDTPAGHVALGVGVESGFIDVHPHRLHALQFRRLLPVRRQLRLLRHLARL